MSSGKRKRKINFSVRERIVPGSLMGIIPFISDAVAHLVALHDTQEMPFFNIEPFDLDEIFSNNKLNNSLLEVHTIDLSFATLPQYIDNPTKNNDFIDTISRFGSLQDLDIPQMNSVSINREVSNMPMESAVGKDSKTNPNFQEILLGQPEEEEKPNNTDDANNTDKPNLPTIQELSVPESTITAPNANNDIYSMNKNGVLEINLLSNDSGENISFVLLSQPLYGSLSQNGNDGNYVYTPGTNFHGNDSFTYQISNSAGSDIATATINIKNTNDNPLAVNDTITLNEDSSETFNVLTNDTDIDGNSLTISSFTNPINGNLIQNPDNTFTYTPNTNYNGNDSFTYTISDGQGGTSTETVNISVNPINDNPLAVNDTITLNEDTTQTFNVLTNDTDIDGNSLIISSFTNPIK